MALVIFASIGCGGSGNLARQLVQPPKLEPKGQGKCQVSKGQDRPLIVEWPAADRTALEAVAKRGTVVVRYAGCEVEILAQCRAPGSYTYTPTTIKVDNLSIKDADELYAKVPLGAARLEAQLARAGELNVAMTVVGRYQIEATQVSSDQLEGMCEGATHAIFAMTAGAFELAAGASANAGASAEVLGRGGGAKSESSKQVLNRDGELDKCKAATADDTAPPEGCGALLRLEVAAISPPGAPSKPVVVVPRALPPPPPPTVTAKPTPPAPPPAAAAKDGVVEVHIDSNLATIKLFSMSEAHTDLHKEVCRVPCDQLVDGSMGQRFRLRTEEKWVGDEFMLIGQPSELTLIAKRTDKASRGKKVAGIVVLSVGGAAVIAGLMTAFFTGASDSMVRPGEEPPNTTPGYVATGILIPTGVLAAGGGLWMLLTSGTKYEVVVPQNIGRGGLPLIRF